MLMISHPGMSFDTKHGVLGKKADSDRTTSGTLYQPIQYENTWFCNVTAGCILETTSTMESPHVLQ